MSQSGTREGRWLSLSPSAGHLVLLGVFGHISCPLGVLAEFRLSTAGLSPSTCHPLIFDTRLAILRCSTFDLPSFGFRPPTCRPAIL